MAIAGAVRGRGATMVYASWNGATDVATWRVLAGRSARTLSVAGAAPKRSFETAILVNRTARYFAVQAVADSGQVLATSRAVTMSGRG